MMLDFKKIRIIGLVLLIFIGTVDCHRKVGVKPGGDLKKKSKCKCKTDKGGIYGTVKEPATYKHKN